MTKKCFFVDVFTDKPYAGNQLAVFPDADDLTAQQMQKIANEINYSETTFILKNTEKDADYNIRIFTIKQELPFAGHPVLGTAYAIKNILKLHRDGKLRLRTKVGIIPLEQGNGALWMRQNRPEFAKIYTDKNKIVNLIDLSPDDISDDLPAEEVSTGNSILIIPVKTLDAVQRSMGNINNMKKFFSDESCIAPYVFTLETTNMSAHVHTRFFAAHMGIIEDAATGSAAGPLTGYLLKHEVFGKSFEIINEQGIEMGRPSRIMMRGMLKDDEYTVEIGGKCSFIGTGEFTIEQ